MRSFSESGLLQWPPVGSGRRLVPPSLETQSVCFSVKHDPRLNPGLIEPGLNLSVISETSGDST